MTDQNEEGEDPQTLESPEMPQPQTANHHAETQKPQNLTSNPEEGTPGNFFPNPPNKELHIPKIK